MGASVLFLGKHADAIRILNEAVRKEGQPDLIYPFVGARTLLAFAHARAGSWSAARERHLDSLDALRGSDHIYTTCFETLSACGLGEIELRSRNESAALTYFRRARRIIGESRRTAGSARLLIRINAGLAAAYASTGDIARARELQTRPRRKSKALLDRPQRRRSSAASPSSGSLWPAPRFVSATSMPRQRVWLTRGNPGGSTPPGFATTRNSSLFAAIPCSPRSWRISIQRKIRQFRR